MRVPLQQIVHAPLLKLTGAAELTEAFVSVLPALNPQGERRSGNERNALLFLATLYS